ncbi:MAG: hypothetical protein RMJ53_10080, partial [Chitinophagales bacterium]|nr:hypothetical protein [Chitinophagales bacterium]
INNKVTLLYAAISLCLLLLSGRSYYFPYLHIVFITFVLANNSDLILNKRFKVLPTEVVSAFMLITGIVIPLFLAAVNIQSANQHKKILFTIRKETQSWNNKNRYFTPPDLTMEAVFHPSARLHYHFLYVYQNYDLNEGDKIYMCDKSQMNWLRKNFGSYRFLFDTLVPPSHPSLRISSFYKLKKVYDTPKMLLRASPVFRAQADSLTTGELR